jgi:hypothetical protein
MCNNAYYKKCKECVAIMERLVTEVGHSRMRIEEEHNETAKDPNHPTQFES